MDSPLKSVFTKRQIEGSRQRANSHRGKIRGIILRPEQMLDLIRDTYQGAPIPMDAQLFALGIEARENLLQLYFSSASNPLVRCIQLRPTGLLEILKAKSEGMIPSDAELKGISIHQHFTVLRMEVASDKFAASETPSMPMIQMRYELGKLLVLDQSQAEQKEKLVAVI